MPVVHPFGGHGERHQDRFDASSGFEAEHRSPVVDQIEFDVASSPVELELPLFLGGNGFHSVPYDWQIGINESVARILYESECFFRIILEVIKEDSSNPSSFLSMLEVEVFITPIFEF